MLTRIWRAGEEVGLKDKVKVMVKHLSMSKIVSSVSRRVTDKLGSCNSTSCHAWPLKVTHLSETMLFIRILCGARLCVALTMSLCLLWSSHGYIDINQSLLCGT